MTAGVLTVSSIGGFSPILMLPSEDQALLQDEAAVKMDEEVSIAEHSKRHR